MQAQRASLGRSSLLVGVLVLLAGLSALVRPQPVAAAGVVSDCTTDDELRAAVAGGGTVTFSCSGTITLTSQLELTRDAVIDSGDESVTLSGNGSTSLVMIDEGVEVTLSGLTLIHGNAELSGEGGAIFNAGRLTIINSTLSNNAAFNGGAIFNSGDLTISTSMLTNNAASTGGAIDNEGTLALKSSTLTGNQGTDHESGSAAAIQNSGDAMITNSTFQGNTAKWRGSVIINSAGNLSLSASTLADNDVYEGTIIANYIGVVKLTANILSGSGLSRSVCGGVTAVTSGGSNLISDNSCKLSGLDWQLVQPQLGALDNNGGLTPTMLPQSGSLVFDRVPNHVCAQLSAANGGVDQRGVPRPVGDAPCDSGAVEVSGAVRCGWKSGRPPEPPNLTGWEC